MPTLRLFSLVIFELLVLGGARAAEPEAVEVRTLTGQTIKGNLESVNDKELVIAGNGPVAVAQIVDLVFSANQPQAGETLGTEFPNVKREDGSTVRVEGPPSFVRALPKWLFLRARGPAIPAGSRGADAVA